MLILYLLFYLIERDKVLNNIEKCYNVNISTQLKNVNNVNNKKTRDDVRRILREKFRK